MINFLRKAMALPVFLIISSLACFTACSEKQKNIETPLFFGIEPIPSAISSTSYYDILLNWSKKDYRKMAVLHISPNDGLAFIPQERMNKIQKIFRNGKAGPYEKTFITRDNYLYAAARLGLIRKVYWIVPYNHLSFIDAEERIQSFLQTETSYFRKNDIASMKFNNGCVSGNLFNVAVHMCSPSSMPFLEESTIAVIDTGFFPSFAAHKRISKLGAMKMFFEDLAIKKLKVRSVCVVSPAEIKAMHGYLSEETISLIKDPAILKQAAPPSIWVIRDKTDNMLTGGGFREAVNNLNANAKESSGDPYLIIMKETARTFLNEKSDSLDVLARLCAEKDLFCRAIADTGVMLGKAEKLKAAEAFLKKAASLNDRFEYAKLEHARILFKSDKYASALKVLEDISDQGISFAAEMLRGDCAYLLKNEDKALAHFEKAVAIYREAGGYRMSVAEQKGLDRLRSIYEKKGDLEGLKKLEIMPQIE